MNDDDPTRPRATYAYPLMLDVAGRLIVIIGGGAVAARKVAGIVEAGGTRIRCVAPHFRAEFPPEVEKVAESFTPRHLDGAALVFATTDSSAVNDAVVAEARSRGIWVNRSDAADSAEGQRDFGDFVTPALLRRSAVAVTVSAGSPALTARIRDGLAERWDDRWSAMADAMRALRPMLVSASAGTQADRASLFRELATEPALDVLGSAGFSGLCRWLAGRFPQWASVLSSAGKAAQ